MIRLFLPCALFVGLTLEASASTPIAEHARSMVGRQHFGVYMFKQKVGYGAFESKLTTFQGKPALLSRTEFKMTMAMQGETSTSHSVERTWYSLEGDGPVLRVVNREVEDGVVTVETLRRKGKGWVVETQTGDRVSTRKVAAPITSIGETLKEEKWLASGPKPGDKTEAWSLDLSEEDINEKELIEYVRRESQVHSGVPTTVHVVKATFSGVAAEMKMVDTETFLEARVGDMIRLVAEPEHIAKKMGAKVVDFSRHLDVPLDKDLGPDPEKVDRLELQLSGPAKLDLPVNHRQTKRAGPENSVVLQIQRGHRTAKATPLSSAERKEWTKAEPGIESDDARILKAARRVVRKKNSAMERAEALQSWIFWTLKKTASKNAESALTILEQKAGDCTEHARLFVAMARALGMPAREVGGLMYVNDGRPRLVWHAWAEFHDGHQWVGVDPAWNQVRVDATHVRISHGTDDMSWVGMLGQLQAKVLSFKAQK